MEEQSACSAIRLFMHFSCSKKTLGGTASLPGESWSVLLGLKRRLWHGSEVHFALWPGPGVAEVH